MFATISLLVVPVVAVVVLSALVVFAGRQTLRLSLGILGVFGVVLGGPGAMLMLRAQADEPALDRFEQSPIDSAPDVEGKSDSESVPAANADDKEAAGQLTVGLRGRIKLPADAPDWVKSPPTKDPHAVYISVTGLSAGERDKALEKQRNEEVRRFVDDYLHERNGWFFISQQTLQMPSWKDGGPYDQPPYESPSLRELKSKEYMVYRKHAVLEFDEPFRKALDREWAEVKTSNRLMLAGVIGFATVLLLGTIFAYFRLDNATRGFYTGRLQFLAVAAILALIAAGVLAAYWIPWR